MLCQHANVQFAQLHVTRTTQSVSYTACQIIPQLPTGLQRSQFNTATGGVCSRVKVSANLTVLVVHQLARYPDQHEQKHNACNGGAPKPLAEEA